MADNYLEQLVAEWYEYKGYFVKKNLWVGKLSSGGYECELDDGTFIGNTASGNDVSGFIGTFSGGNTAVFSNNSATNNTDGYNLLNNTPFSGVGTNSGSGNGDGNSF